MKTNKLKCLAVVSGFVLFASAYPAFSQSDTNIGSSPARPSMSQAAEGARMDEPAGADNDADKNWGWLGLLGLAGLFGLKKAHDVRDENYRTART